jgi:hypothetical protein
VMFVSLPSQGPLRVYTVHLLDAGPMRTLGCT